MDPSTVLILFASGFGAGVVTGLIGASAATFMAAILIFTGGYGAYEAIGISLATDIFASLTSADIFFLHKRIDLKRGLLIALIAVCFAYVGSLLSRGVPDFTLGKGIGVVTLFVGVQLLRKSVQERIREFGEHHPLIRHFGEKKTFASLFFGALIGTYCGFFGAGGGMLILLVLLFVLGYEMRTAVGTSVLIMVFIASSGAVGHFVGKAIPFLDIIVAAVGGVVGALIAARYANSVSERKVSNVAGVILIIMGVMLIAKNWLF